MPIWKIDVARDNDHHVIVWRTERSPRVYDSRTGWKMVQTVAKSLGFHVFQTVGLTHFRRGRRVGWTGNQVRITKKEQCDEDHNRN